MNVRQESVNTKRKAAAVTRALKIAMDFVADVLPSDIMQELHKKVSQEAPDFVLETRSQQNGE